MYSDVFLGEISFAERVSYITHHAHHGIPGTATPNKKAKRPKATTEAVINMPTKSR